MHTSDHFPIFLTLKDFTHYTYIPRFNYNKANWNDFKALIDTIRDILNFNNIDDIIEHFNDRVIRAAEQSIPKKGGEFYLRPVPLWNEEIIQNFTTKKISF